jgi:hypothetical protein
MQISTFCEGLINKYDFYPHFLELILLAQKRIHFLDNQRSVKSHKCKFIAAVSLHLKNHYKFRGLKRIMGVKFTL